MAYNSDGQLCFDEYRYGHHGNGNSLSMNIPPRKKT
jgi:hypothetical protein